MIPQEEKEKQDHELEAATRWLNRPEGFINDHSVTILGDDLYSNQPFCKAVIDKKLKYIFVCKPKSHKELYKWIDFYQKNEEIDSFSKRIWTGKEHHNYIYRFINNIPIRDSEDALNVNWAEIIITNDSGKKVYSNAFISNHTITKTNIESFIEAGRARWKIENETNNTLKTKGYNLEHNFGHGKQYLSQTLATLTILAFLFHTVLSFVDKRYQMLRNNLGRRDTFFHDISALMKYMIFEHWIHLLKTMLTGLELEDPG